MKGSKIGHGVLELESPIVIFEGYPRPLSVITVAGTQKIRRQPSAAVVQSSAGPSVPYPLNNSFNCTISGYSVHDKIGDSIVIEQHEDLGDWNRCVLRNMASELELKSGHNVVTRRTNSIASASVLKI